MQYLYPYNEALKKSKVGIDLAIFETDTTGAQLVLVDVEVGHLEEFYHDTSTFMYLVLEGEGTFMLNDEPVQAKAKDVVVAPPKTRIHYFGKMKLVLCTTPAYTPEGEHHVREVKAEESPYASR